MTAETSAPDIDHLRSWIGREDVAVDHVAEDLARKMQRHAEHKAERLERHTAHKAKHEHEHGDKD